MKKEARSLRHGQIAFQTLWAIGCFAVGIMVAVGSIMLPVLWGADVAVVVLMAALCLFVLYIGYALIRDVVRAKRRQR